MVCGNYGLTSAASPAGTGHLIGVHGYLLSTTSGSVLSRLLLPFLKCLTLGRSLLFTPGRLGIPLNPAPGCAAAPSPSAGLRVPAPIQAQRCPRPVSAWFMLSLPAPIWCWKHLVIPSDRWNAQVGGGYVT